LHGTKSKDTQSTEENEVSRTMVLPEIQFLVCAYKDTLLIYKVADACIISLFKNTNCTCAVIYFFFFCGTGV
jgi:hypothetical protein